MIRNCSSSADISVISLSTSLEFCVCSWKLALYNLLSMSLVQVSSTSSLTATKCFGSWLLPASYTVVILSQWRFESLLLSLILPIELTMYHPNSVLKGYCPSFWLRTKSTGSVTFEVLAKSKHQHWHYSLDTPSH